MSDDLDRDRFYTPAPGVDDEDDFEYEVEAPDPEVLAAEERRAKEVVAATERSIDIDAIYRDVDRDRSGEILHEWVQNLRFQFQVKHLFIATAVLAILLTLWRLDVLGTALVLGAMFGVIGLYLYLQWKEKQHQDELAARRSAMYERSRTAHHSAGGRAGTMGEQPASVASPLPNEVDQAWREAMDHDRVRLQFSLKQLLLVMVLAAIVMGLVNLLGGPQNAASLLGLVALTGLVAHALGYEPPGIVALAWWLLLVMYVMLSIFGVMWGALK
jgi:hypothetical protein